jgi:hypothetical protein
MVQGRRVAIPIREIDAQMPNVLAGVDGADSNRGGRSQVRRSGPSCNADGYSLRRQEWGV